MFNSRDVGTYVAWYVQWHRHHADCASLLPCCPDDNHEVDPSLRDLLFSSSYLDMLNDDRRNRAYSLAINKVVKPGETSKVQQLRRRQTQLFVSLQDFFL